VPDRIEIPVRKVTGETNSDSTPEHLDWAGEQLVSAVILYDQTPEPGPDWRNTTINTDQDYVFCGRLTTLR
jgi:hypothetical protein